MAWKTRVKSVSVYDVDDIEKAVNDAIEELEGEVGNLVIRDIKMTAFNNNYNEAYTGALIIYEIH